MGVHTITAKQLHQETSSVLDQLEKGASVVVTRNGRAVARLEPVGGTEPPRWDDVMSEVWKAQTEVKRADIVENPVLAERKRRRR
jgi:antitoxin (DNA-binding transcriptional repressor) of toxin-antitoxin stability system